MVITDTNHNTDGVGKMKTYRNLNNTTIRVTSIRHVIRKFDMKNKEPIKIKETTKINVVTVR